MKRSKRHRVKQELPETSTSRTANPKEHDLAYYIHDRVELMHQVFSVLKPKELKSMAPECVRHISISDLQELCMEELLGISSKRLCAILDGATPPSDTESSSESEQLETISLDSISSDEEILSQVSSKKSKKHKHRSKSKPKKRKSKDNEDEDKDQVDRSRRAGLTVLELLELQARARAIRAQLQQEQASAVSTGQPSESVVDNSSDDAVEIKEETAEVVEISSEDEKPNIQELQEKITTVRKDTESDHTLNTKTVTKKVNNLIITVPKANTSRKIKLKRNTSTNLKPSETTLDNHSQTGSSMVIVEETCATHTRSHRSEKTTEILSRKLSKDAKATETLSPNKNTEKTKEVLKNLKDRTKCKDKKKKKKRDKQKDKDGSDHDEITLQLSDTEKMDLLEDLEGKKSEKCSDTEDSSTDSSDEDSTKKDSSDEDNNGEPNDLNIHNKGLLKESRISDNFEETQGKNENVSTEENMSNDTKINEVKSPRNKQSCLENVLGNVDKQFIEQNATDNKLHFAEHKNENYQMETINPNTKNYSTEKNDNVIVDSEDMQIYVSNKIGAETSCTNNIPLETPEIIQAFNIQESTENTRITPVQKIVNSEEHSVDICQDMNNRKVTIHQSETNNVSDKDLEHKIANKELASDTEKIKDIEETNNEVNVEKCNKDDLKEKSEGELSDRDSSEVEASDFKQDVVCISDDEENKGKKKKKKDKKCKKEKKSKKKKDFRESADENFYREKNEDVTSQLKTSSSMENIEDASGKEIVTVSEVELNEKDIKYTETKSLKSEIINMNINLDNDVYEILELSDDSSCYEVEEISISKEPTAEEIEALSAKVDELEKGRNIDSETQEYKDSEILDNVSWKDRYLKSTKVKKVLTTANIMNAMRKKNLELKKKLQDSKNENKIDEHYMENIEKPTDIFEDGSIEQYNTLETSTKYVDPVKEVIQNADNVNEIINEPDTKIVQDQNETSNSGTIIKDTVTKEMKKEAKQLLKMYKMLLKYNDMTKQKDPSKKKKKKKKSKDKDKNVSNDLVNTN